MQNNTKRVLSLAAARPREQHTTKTSTRIQAVPRRQGSAAAAETAFARCNQEWNGESKRNREAVVPQLM